MKFLKTICFLASLPIVSHAAPVLSLFQVGSLTANSTTINLGTPTLSLDINLNSGGLTVSGIQFSLSTTGPSSVNYGAVPISLYSGNPFVAGDAGLSPVPNSLVNVTQETSFFKSSGADYSATTASFAVFQFNTSALSSGIYILRPNFSLYTNSANIFENPSDFGTPGTFTLTVVPEPSTYALMALGSLMIGGVCLKRKSSKI